MRNIGLKRGIGALLISGLLVAFGSGCTKYASEENLKQLEMQQQAAISAEQKRDNLIKEQEQLEKILAEKQDELKAVEAEKAAVLKRAEEKNHNQEGEK